MALATATSTRAWRYRIWDYDATRAKASEKKEGGEYDLPSPKPRLRHPHEAGNPFDRGTRRGRSCNLGICSRSRSGRTLRALQHFISCLFLRLGQGDDPVAFERVWRATVEYGLAADWSQPGLWFYGERLEMRPAWIRERGGCTIKLPPGAALRMKGLYKRWAVAHLARDEECITRFCHFLTTNFGAPIRLDGARWLAAMLKCQLSSRWYREDTGDALIELVAAALISDADHSTRRSSTAGPCRDNHIPCSQEHPNPPWLSKNR